MSSENKILKSESQAPMQAQQQLPSVAPACDVYENDDEFLVIADLPGVKREHLDIEFERGELLLEGRREDATESVVGSDYRLRDFRRRFAVPGGIEPERVTAELARGVLTLHLPKSPSQKSRQIQVRGG